MEVSSYAQGIRTTVLLFPSLFVKTLVFWSPRSWPRKIVVHNENEGVMGSIGCWLRNPGSPTYFSRWWEHSSSGAECHRLYHWRMYTVNNLIHLSNNHMRYVLSPFLRKQPKGHTVPSHAMTLDELRVLKYESFWWSMMLLQFNNDVHYDEFNSRLKI